MKPVTRLLKEIESGNEQASSELFTRVYDELRKLASAKLDRERSDHTLQATALVHEVYLRLLGDLAAGEWSSRGHFFAAAAESMRRILIENARARKARKRGGDQKRIEWELNEHPALSKPDKVLALNDALTALATKDPTKAELVQLRFFAGLTNREAAAALGISVATADRYWAYSKAWLQVEMEKES